MKHYTLLARHQRYQIQALIKADHRQIEVADVIGAHKATVSATKPTATGTGTCAAAAATTDPATGRGAPGQPSAAHSSHCVTSG